MKESTFQIKDKRKRILDESLEDLGFLISKVELTLFRVAEQIQWDMDKCHQKCKGAAHERCLSGRGTCMIHLDRIHFYLTLCVVASFILVIYCVSKDSSHFSLC